MRPTTLLNTIKLMHRINRPLYIEGPPGLGKTQISQQAARELKVPTILFHGPTMQPEDVAIPSANTDKTTLKFLINNRFPIEGSEWPDEGQILIDELPQSEMSVQKAMAHLIQERDIHGHKLKSGWSIVATGNRAADRAGANRILSHLRNRMTTIEFEPSLDDWCNWAASSAIKPEIISFIRFKPNMLAAFDPQRDLNPTPRAWSEGVSPIIDVVGPDAEYECIKGAVGEGAAAEFMGYLKIFRELPDPDLIIKNPDKHNVPKEPSVRYALAGALAHRADTKNFSNVMLFARRMPPEFCVLIVLDAIHRDESLQNTKSFIDWATTEGAKILV